MKRLPVLLLVCTATACAQRTPPNFLEPKDLDEAKATIQRMYARSQDWAQLLRYRQANAELPAPRPGEARVVFFGDSITDVWKLADFFPGKPYVNRGISGQTTPQMLVRMMPDVIALQPRALVILAGTNDLAGNTGPEALEDIEHNLTAIAELARVHKISIVLASLLPVHDQGPNKQSERRPPDKIRELNHWMQQYCAQTKCLYLDYHSHMTDAAGMLRPELSRDGLHPNEAGYKIMAPLAEQAIAQALKKKT